MNRPLLFIIALLCSFLLVLDRRPASRAQNDELLAIVGAEVVDGTGAEPRAADVLIHGDRIVAISTNLAIPPGARVIKAEGQTLLPGLFDLHTHLPYASGGGVTGDWPKNLQAYLYCGVTSVVDFGTYGETFEPMRRLIKTGVVAAPRISYAIRISTPGGHGAEGGRGDFFSFEVSTAREARAAIRRALPWQPDVIKAFTDGWRYGAAPDLTSMNQETLSALVDEAHKNGLAVLTHTVTLDKAKIAARAGVDVIAHGIGDQDVDDELLKLLREKSTTYAPTLAVYEPRGRDILSPLLATVLDPVARANINPPLVAPGPVKLAPATGSVENGDPPRVRRWGVLQRNTAALNKAGVNFGAGTDAGVTGTHHGWATLRELQLLVAGGLTPLEAITAATGNAARALQVDNERGAIAVGKLADLVLIEGAPHRNISDIEKIRAVFLGGRELDRERLAREMATTALTPLPAVKAKEQIDDFEAPGAKWNGRSLLNTLWINSTDSGADSSQILFGRTLRSAARAARNYALSVLCRMAEKERPFARVSVPLSRGAVEPVDAREFKGVQFDARGEGEYRLLIPVYGQRRGGPFQAQFNAGGEWRTIRLDFSSFTQEFSSGQRWTGADLLLLSFELARQAGETGWLELDNLRFYR